MRFMLLQYYAPVESGMGPIDEWSEADVQAHMEFQIASNQELAASGELVDVQGLALPDAADSSSPTAHAHP